jgi:hypothetical protein
VPFQLPLPLEVTRKTLYASQWASRFFSMGSCRSVSRRSGERRTLPNIQWKGAFVAHPSFIRMNSRATFLRTHTRTQPKLGCYSGVVKSILLKMHLTVCWTSAAVAFLMGVAVAAHDPVIETDGQAYRPSR